MDAVPCPSCGDKPTIDHDYTVWAICDNCYDGAPDAGPQSYGQGRTESEAIAEWNERAESNP